MSGCSIITLPGAVELFDIDKGELWKTCHELRFSHQSEQRLSCRDQHYEDDGAACSDPGEILGRMPMIGDDVIWGQAPP